MEDKFLEDRIWEKLEKKMAINEKNGKPAVTHYKVLKRFSTDKMTYIASI